MEMILENKGVTTSTPDYSFLMSVVNFTLAYTTEQTIVYSLQQTSEQIIPLQDNEINSMSLAYAESAFKDGWDDLSEEEDRYWNSFLEI